MCKLEKYGNCDEKTEDQEYCIFHKPGKNEEEAREFYEKFLDRFKPRKEKIMVQELGEEEKKEVERFVFGEVGCSGYVFPEIPVDFEFSFKSSVFAGHALFTHATFQLDAQFSDTTFQELTWFGDATFEGEVWFDYATFHGFALFDYATFQEHAWFNDATFQEQTQFANVTFQGDAGFINATFEGGVWFDGAVFEGIVYFFETEDSKYRFRGELSFSKADFRRGVEIDIPHELFKLPEAEAEACRVQRISYERDRRKDDADRMFVRERRALRKARVRQATEEWSNSKGIKSKLRTLPKLIIAGSSSFLEFLLADLTCKYGTSWVRPVALWLGVIFLLFPPIYWASGGVEAGGATLNSAWDYPYFSVVTATTLGYGDLHAVGFAKVFAAMEAVFGTFMWAVFLAVFARKHMR
ncbi:MAG: potassium channel family protein [Dehalococcoidia bacterium]